MENTPTTTQEAPRKIHAGIRLPEPLNLKLSRDAKRLSISRNSLAILAMDRGLEQVNKALTPSYELDNQ